MNSITNQVLSSGSYLAALLGDYTNNHVGYVYSMDFKEACVLTNDTWKEHVNGIPHNSFLVATAINPQKVAETRAFDDEVILLRVLGPAGLPSDADLLAARIEHNQRRITPEIYSEDERDGLDPITHNEFQYGALKCRVLGTFYTNEGDLRLGSDLENYVCSTRLRVFKPRGEALNKIVNHVNPEIRNKALSEAKKSGFSSLPSPINIGTVRYTSTDRLHRGQSEILVPVSIQPTDFLARRTAVLGMTRTGKSNTVKATVASVSVAAKTDGIKVGQIIFDINGEYANANHQDDGSSLAEVFDSSCVRYRAVETPGFKDLRTNFYLESDKGLSLLQELFRKDSPPYSGQDLDTVMSSNLEEPDSSARSEHNRWKVRRAVFQCILRRAKYDAPSGFLVEVPISKKLVDQVAKVDPAVTVPSTPKVLLDDACAWFEAIRRANIIIKEEQAEKNKATIGIESSSKGKPWVDPELEAYLNFLVRETSRKLSFGGYRAITRYRNYHSSKRGGDVVDEIIRYLAEGKIVILDLSAGPVSVRTVLSKRIASQIFYNALNAMNRGEVPQNTVIYVEEAHNLIGAKDDLTDTWPRIAKEGAKAKIAFVYATQEPSSIHPNILANTENWFVTHLNNDDELKALGKFYDFADFKDSLKTAQDVGFARIKTMSSPYVIPTQIKRFTPSEIAEELRLNGGS